MNEKEAGSNQGGRSGPNALVHGRPRWRRENGKNTAWSLTRALLGHVTYLGQGPQEEWASGLPVSFSLGGSCEPEHLLPRKGRDEPHERGSVATVLGSHAQVAWKVGVWA